MQREAELLLAEEGRLLTLAAHEAVVDPLTGLYNRRYLSRCLDDVVARAGRAGTPISFLMIDVDHFKDVNDSRGHFCGDDVLRKIARILDKSRRAGDIAVRYGGDEFLMLAPNTDAQAARKFAERLRDAVATGDFKVDVDVTVSIGTATLHGPADGVPEISLHRRQGALRRQARRPQLRLRRATGHAGSGNRGGIKHDRSRLKARN